MMARPPKKTTALTIRMDADLRRRLELATSAGPYALSLTSIIERGAELALQELEAIRSSQGPGSAEQASQVAA